MEIEVIKSDKDSVEFKLIGQRHAFPNLLKKALLEQKETEFAAYKLLHPLDKDAVFFLRVKSSEPKAVLAKAIKEIVREAKEFEQEVKKVLG